MSNLAKRLFDIFAAVVGLLLLAIPFIVIVVVIRLESSGPSIYWSQRVGRYGCLFYMPKFRTMYINTPELPSDELEQPLRHITGVGGWLRKYSVDELPQLFSVLRGDMSIVGPRPMIAQLEEFTRIRHETGVDTLRPGITGWAQINGRDNLSFEQKIAFDVEYKDQRSFLFDLKVIVKTVGYVLRAQGVWH